MLYIIYMPYVFASYNISAMSFLGCFKNIQIASRGTYYQDLMSGVYVGVQGGCSTKVSGFRCVDSV